MSLADEDVEESSTSSPSTPVSSSANFALSAVSEMAHRIVRENLGLSSEQFQQLAKLAVLVDDWNSKINLISRVDCSPDVVYGRHILPSLAPLALLTSEHNKENDNLLELSSGQTVCDVGTGGGFPGLPLAIARPDIEFLLVDSVGKKITAVQDMADQLGLTNVKTYHGRAESVSGKFSWVVGRSVSALPTYCFWIHHLLEKPNGRLVYLIGGEIDEDILEEAILDEEIEDLLDVPGISDKRVLVFPRTAVDLLAEVSGEILKVPKRGGGSGSRPGGRRNGKPNGNKRKKRDDNAKGQWTKRDSSAAKDRGYSNFKRFDSLDK
jgi:16S rRNA (guanine527-N7)-methyltransferase